jgi:hypothetical protein
LRFRAAAVLLQKLPTLWLAWVQVLDQRARFREGTARFALKASRVAVVTWAVRAADEVARGSRRLAALRYQLGPAPGTREVVDAAATVSVDEPVPTHFENDRRSRVRASVASFGPTRQQQFE